MYVISDELAETGKIKRYEKKHIKEAASCFANLMRIFMLLNSGIVLDRILHCCSFFRSEGEGVYRIGQTGICGAKETRLYVYVRVEGEKIYKLTMGDKDSQLDDINRCKQIVRKAKEA